MKATLLALVIIAASTFGVIKFGYVFDEQAQLALGLRGIKAEALSESAIRHYRKIAPTLKTVEDATIRDAFKVIGADLNSDGQNDAIVTLEYDAVCGNAGCLATIYLQDRNERFVPVNFKYTVKTIAVLETVSNGMRDIQINDDTQLQLIWNGKTYEPS